VQEIISYLGSSEQTFYTIFMLHDTSTNPKDTYDNITTILYD